MMYERRDLGRSCDEANKMMLSVSSGVRASPAKGVTRQSPPHKTQMFELHLKSQIQIFQVSHPHLERNTATILSKNSCSKPYFRIQYLPAPSKHNSLPAHNPLARADRSLAIPRNIKSPTPSRNHRHPSPQSPPLQKSASPHFPSRVNHSFSLTLLLQSILTA